MNIKKKKKISSSTYRNKLLEMIKTEIATVYLTSNQKKFLSLNDALECESGEEVKREIIKNKEDEIMKIYGWKYIENAPKYRYIFLRGNRKLKKKMFEQIEKYVERYPKI